MDKQKRSALRRFRRVHEFLTSNTVEGTSTKLQVLDEVLADMAGMGEEKDVSDRVTRAETARQRALRDRLWTRHMVPISRIARRVFGVPGMDVKLKLPARRGADNEKILNAARGMAQVAEQHAASFQQEGLPAEFVTQFRAAIDELAGALTARVQGQNRQKTSREALVTLVRRGVAAIDVLDAIVKPRLESQPDLLAAWNSVKRPIEPGGGASVAEMDVQPIVKVA